MRLPPRALPPSCKMPPRCKMPSCPQPLSHAESALSGSPVHGPHMYNFWFKHGNTKKFGFGIGTYVLTGLYLPWFAFEFSQKKAGTPGW